MTRAFWLGIRLYLRWLAEAFGRRGRRLAPLGIRRLGILLLGFPLFLLIQLLHWLGFALDEIFFRGYRRTPIKSPLFVTGIPRSGTTFLHRSLARDEHDFTTFRMWEALIAPSITERRLIGAVAGIDRLLGAPLHRLTRWITRRLAGRLAHIHEVGLDAPEEDYLTLLPAAGCFILVLAFPGSRDVWRLARFGDMPARERGILLDFYTVCLKKHLYADGGHRRLLSKNAAFGAWVPDLAAHFPDARFMICLREPEIALHSQLSSLCGGMQGFGTGPAAATFGREFTATFEHVLQRLFHAWQHLPPERMALIDHAALKADGRGALQQALDQLEWPITPALTRVLEEVRREARDHASQHRHRPPAGARIAPEAIARMSDIYTALLADSAGTEPMTPTTPPSSPAPIDTFKRSDGSPPRQAPSLRVAIFSDALPERNGAGAYYEDIAPQLAARLAELRLFRPTHRKRLWRLALPLPGDPTQKLIVPNLIRIRREFRALQPDLVISVTPGPFGLLGLHHARKSGCGFISAFHTHFEGLIDHYGSSWFFRGARTYLHHANRKLFRHSETVLVNNSDLRETVESLGATRVQVMGTPLAPAFLDSPPAPASGRLQRILFAGRLAPEKNLPALEEAIESRPELEFVLAGDGPLRGEFERLRELCPNLRLTGWLDRRALKEEMDAADLLVLPSHQETFGTVALEAMARGRPALVAESAGIHNWPELGEALFTLSQGQTLSSALAELETIAPAAWQARADAARHAAERLNAATIEQWMELIETYGNLKSP